MSQYSIIMFACQFYKSYHSYTYLTGKTLRTQNFGPGFAYVTLLSWLKKLQQCDVSLNVSSVILITEIFGLQNLGLVFLS